MSALERAVEVMDRLRSPGGCPWDAEQTHQSLAKYLLEETYETLEAIEVGDLSLLREELGDILLQVLFHARLAQEADGGFGIEDVANDLVDKLVQRHPHVFEERTSAAAIDADQVNENWERLKAEQKQRSSLTDGVPTGQPALALASKLVSRVARSSLSVEPPPTDEFGDRLFALVQESVAAGVDPETSLRQTTRAYRAAILAAEGASNHGRSS